MNFILPLILILSSIGIFFGYVDPGYKGSGSIVESDISTYGIKQLQNEYTKYETTLTNSTKVVQNRKSLTDKNNKITESDKTKLIKMVPDNIDNVKLVLEISSVAEARNLSLKNISIGSSAKTLDSIGPDSTPYGTLALKFSVNATYDNFLNLMKDLEQNLRIIDITDISFTSTDTGFYDFSVSLNTYWLK
ncbi:MAG: type 4a pilus biogenesis protein PilO [Candidatus Paceibacterota bacterium]|jgi:Tfp pilus assembly protein PilO